MQFDINHFIEQQLAAWPLAADNYHALGHTERRHFRLGDFDCYVQYNPARAISTAAKVDAESVAKRPCFLCSANRPKEQMEGPTYDGWQLLLNPYPIFPVHFTLPFVKHEPQGEIPFEMAVVAEANPQLAVFFNGAHAGASAPDHAHMQAVLKSELPLVHLVERLHPASEAGLRDSRTFDASLPFHFKSAVVTHDLTGMKALADIVRWGGVDAATGLPDRDLVNAIMWIDSEGYLRVVVIPRTAHRPRCYSLPEGERLMVSPGTIDMAGILVLPRREDFERITEEDIRRIYADTADASLIEVSNEKANK